MSYFNEMRFSDDQITKSLAGSLRVAQLTTLFDGKVLNTDNTFIWQNIGTGTPTFQNNKLNMSVSAGQYYIRQSKRFMPYFSGKTQIIEQTFDNFGIQANVEKRAGYFSGNVAAPYDTTYDGFYLENDGTTFRIRVKNAGIDIFNIPFASWDNYDLLSGYDFNNFTVIFWEFLWLGGAGLRLWIATDNGFVMAHSCKYVGNFQDTIFRSPNQPVRYEIRSTGGSGSLRAICSQVASEGSISESGLPLSIKNNTAIIANSVGTIYALKSIRKLASERDISVKLLNMGATPTATSDAGFLTLFLNPTLSAPISYTNKSRIDEGTPTNQTITAGTGRELYTLEIGQNGASLQFNEDYLTWLSQNIDNTFDEYVLGYMPLTANQSIAGFFNLKEYF